MLASRTVAPRAAAFRAASRRPVACSAVLGGLFGTKAQTGGESGFYGFSAKVRPRRAARRRGRGAGAAGGAPGARGARWSTCVAPPQRVAAAGRAAGASPDPAAAPASPPRNPSEH
jgi:hypothetical protein